MPVHPNARHELFAQEMAKGKTVDKAYQLAGFKPNRGNASRLKADASIQSRVAEIQLAIAERVEIDEAYVLSTIKDTVERCKQSKPVFDRRGDPVLTETPEGAVVPAHVFDAKSVLRGAELLGKHIGMFKERVEHTGKDGGPIQTEDLSDMDALRRVRFLMNKAKREQPSIN